MGLLAFSGLFGAVAAVRAPFGSTVLGHAPGRARSAGSSFASSTSDVTGDARVGALASAAALPETASVAVGTDPAGLAYDAQIGAVYVANFGSANVSVVNGTTGRVVANVPVGSEPTGIVYDPAASALFVVNQGSSDVTEIDAGTNTVLGTYAVGSAPEFAALDPVHGNLFVTDTGSNSVSVLNVSNGSLVATIPVGSAPRGIAYDAANARLYVVDASANVVSVLNASSLAVVADVTVGLGPTGVAVDPASDRVFVTDEISGTVTVLNGSSEVPVATVAVGPSPDGLAFDPATDRVYVALASANSIRAMNATSYALVRGYADPYGPQQVLYDPSNGDLYVTNAYTRLLSVVELAAHTVTFVAAGLPPGSSWAVTIGGVTVGNTTARVAGVGVGRLSVLERNASYPIVLVPPAGYGVARIGGPHTPSQTLLTVTGRSTFRVVFGPLETVRFVERGLAARLPWSVALSPALAHGGPASEAAGTTAYTAGTVTSAVYDAAKAEVFVAVDNGSSDGALLVLNGTTGAVVAEVALGGVPSGLAYDAAHGEIYVAGGVAASDVAVVSDVSDSVVATVALGGTVSAVAYDPAGGLVFAANVSSSFTVRPYSVVALNDTNLSVVQVVSVPQAGLAMAFDTGTDELFLVTSAYAVVIGGANGTVLATVGIGGGAGAAYDPAVGKVFVTTGTSGTVAVVDDHLLSVVATVPVGSDPRGIVYDPARGELFVADSGGSELAVLAEANASVVATVALAPSVPGPSVVTYDPRAGSVMAVAGDNLSVVNDTGRSASPFVPLSGSFVTFTVPAGAAYRWNVTGPGAEYKVGRAAGRLTVPLSGTSRTIVFRLVTERVVFLESGLNASARWTVTITGWTTPAITFPPSVTKSAGTGAIVFLLPVGNYTFAISSSDGQVPSAPSGTFSVVVAPSPALYYDLTFS